MFTTLTQAGTGDDAVIENSNLQALVGVLASDGTTQLTQVVSREPIDQVFVAATVAATLTAIQTAGVTPAAATVPLVNGQTSRVFEGAIDEVLENGTGSRLVLGSGLVLETTLTPTEVQALFPSFTTGQVIGSARVNADGTIDAGNSNNITAGAHTTGNYAMSLTKGTCTKFAILPALTGVGKVVGLVLIQGAQTDTNDFTVSARLAADGTTATDHAFDVVLVCITP